ncbi:MAG: PEGA domain-containing protein [Candidatus Cloacimonetes bacterium]|nr:PEGA domain-containing protein [Candidatus Cloacimonadota bacterium]
MKLKLILFFLFISSVLFSAEMVITKPLMEEMGDLTLRQSPKTDMSGNPCALIKISTDLIPFDEIESNRTPVAVVNKIGEVWVYLSAGDKRLYFNKTGFARKNYEIPVNLKENTVYSMTLMGKGYGAEEVDNVVDLTFNINVEGVYITRDNQAPIKTPSTIAQFSISRGTHNFKFEKEGYKTVEQEVVLQDNDLIEITMEEGSSNVRFSSPGIVIIQSDPEGADVELNGQKVGSTSGSYQGNHYAGEYTLTLRKELYHTTSKTFSLEAGQTLDIPTIKLKPKFGYWQVTSNPTNADVYLDEKLIGKTPLSKEKIPSGDHIFRITYNKYKTHQETFVINDGDEPTFNVELKPNFAGLEIDSAPEQGATVFIDGEDVGTTPYLDEMRVAGTYEIRIEKELWSGSSKTVTITPEYDKKELLILTKDFGTLWVKAQDCNIYVNNEIYSSNEVKRNLKAGKYSIKAEREKHIPDEKTVFVNIGETTDVTLQPIPRLGSVSVFAVDKREPDQKIRGAEIFVDDKKSEKKTPSVLELLYGDYEISLKHPKYLELTKNVSLEEGDTKTLTFELDTYSGSLLAKRNKWRTQGWIGMAATALMAGGGVYCNMQSNSHFDDYENAATSSSALNYKQKTEDYENYRNYCYYAASGAAVYAVFSWIKSVVYNGKIEK